MNSRSWRYSKPLQNVATFVKRHKVLFFFARSLLSLKRKAFKKVKVTASMESQTQEHPLFSGNNIAKWIDTNIILKPNFTDLVYTGKIDIIVPIYDGSDYFDALFGSLSNTRLKYRLLIINDCSPDERVGKYLKKLSDSDNRIKVITNKEPLGFFKAVNRAFKYASHHIALLNSGIELPPFWLERLMYPILYLEKIASSTPFTNSANFCKDDVLFGNLTCEMIDKGFQNIKPSYTEIPTGAGFCIGINKKALRKTGGFDEAVSEGCGETNDWCQRAAQFGYKNVLVENLFVYQKHPKYDEYETFYCEKDSLKHIRNFVAMYLLSAYKVTKQIMLFNHDIGGGANEYLEGMISAKLKDGNAVILIRYDINKRVFVFEYRHINNVFLYEIEKIEDLRSILKYIPCQEIYINELFTYPDLYCLLGIIIKIKEEFSCKMVFFIHDYYCLCPSVHLLNNDGNYCGLQQAMEPCEKCFKKTPSFLFYENIQTYRKHWSTFFECCDEILAFSCSSKKIFEQIYGVSDKIIVVPHNVDYIVKPDKQYKTTSTINIGLIGTLRQVKGTQIVKDMLAIIEDNKMNVRIILIGHSADPLQHPCFFETGNYSKETLPLLVLQNDIDIVFIASIAPETFSFTTEESIKMDMPVVAFNIGAPAERIAVYNKGLLVNEIEAETALRQIIDFYKKIKLPLSPYHNYKI